ncbi:MAG: hypothetical protein U9R60_15005 [Bacteroidota bacterium]|nr:hypothetical protein [Bacteroidota bacterium]
MEQASELQTFSRCEFRLKSVQNIRLAGVSVQQINQISDLTLMEMARLTTAFVNKDMPFKLTLNVEVQNPNQSKAALNELEWILFIDNIEMTSGMLTQRIEIPPHGGLAVMPVSIGVDLFDVLSGESADAIINFALNLAGAGNKPTRIMLKAKPTIYVGTKAITYPGYIKIENEFTSGQ